MLYVQEVFSNFHTMHCSLYINGKTSWTYSTDNSDSKSYDQYSIYPWTYIAEIGA